MKNLLFLLLSLILSAAGLTAQAPDASSDINASQPAWFSNQPYFGFAWGPGWSKQHINYEYVFDEPFQPGRVYSFAFQLGYPLSGALSWQLELGLTEHGYRVEGTSIDSGVKIRAKADARLRYLELPLSLTYRLPVGSKNVEVLGLAGLNSGYAVSGSVVARGKGENETRKVSTKVTEKIPLKDTAFSERLDAALLLGAQVVYHSGFGAVFAEARYHFGILNLERNTEVIINPGGGTAYNRTLLLRVGYRHAL